MPRLRAISISSVVSSVYELKPVDLARIDAGVVERGVDGLERQPLLGLGRDPSRMAVCPMPTIASVLIRSFRETASASRATTPLGPDDERVDVELVEHVGVVDAPAAGPS